MTRAKILTALLLLSLAGATHATAQHDAHGGDSAAVAGVVAKFHEALAAGDSVAALALLAEDAVILESGAVETRAEYRSDHLPGDMNFAKAIKFKWDPAHVRIRGDVAWVTSKNTTQGEMNGRAINSVGAELMVLVRTGQVWKISAIHWSSRQRRAG
jgi:ketosteroid isomerase-like protein